MLNLCSIYSHLVSFCHQLHIFRSPNKLTCYTALAELVIRMLEMLKEEQYNFNHATCSGCSCGMPV